MNFWLVFLSQISSFYSQPAMINVIKLHLVFLKISLIFLEAGIFRLLVWSRFYLFIWITLILFYDTIARLAEGECCVNLMKQIITNEKHGKHKRVQLICNNSVYDTHVKTDSSFTRDLWTPTEPTSYHYRVTTSLDNNFLRCWVHTSMQSPTNMNSTAYLKELETWIIWSGNRVPMFHNLKAIFSGPSEPQ